MLAELFFAEFNIFSKIFSKGEPPLAIPAFCKIVICRNLHNGRVIKWL